MRLKKFTLITLILLVSLSIAPIALAKTRQSYMIDYIYTTQNADESFGETSEETAYALEILDSFNSYEVEDFFGIKDKVDIPTLKDNLAENVSQMFDSGHIDLYQLYYTLNSLNRLETLESSLDTQLHNKIYKYLNETSHLTGGFRRTNTSIIANMVSTYFVMNIYTLIDESVGNETLHINWVLSCNNTDGGYGGNQSLSSTLLTTFYAVSIIDDFGYTLADSVETLNYLNSFYISDVNNANYGGYKPDILSTSAMLSSTYFCIVAINKINPSALNTQTSLDWLIEHQNLDGGFSDFIEGSSQRISSILGTYHAFISMELLGGLNLLNEDIFMVEFSYIILIIVLSTIGILAVVIFFIWRKRRI